jgi:hypothetical protein
VLEKLQLTLCETPSSKQKKWNGVFWNHSNAASGGKNERPVALEAENARGTDGCIWNVGK